MPRLSCHPGYLNVYYIVVPLVVGVQRRPHAAGKIYASVESSDMLQRSQEFCWKILKNVLGRTRVSMETFMKKIIFSSMLASLLLLSAGQAPAAQDTSYAKAYELYNIGKYAEVLRIIRPMAEAGNPDAQVLLGKCYENGLGVPQDGAQAVTWFRKAADQGYAEGDLHMGYSYEVGFGVPQNMQEAVAWFRRAADKGLAAAQYKMGVFYNEGRGVEKNAVEAVQWFQKSAAQGNPYAQRYLGACYEHGVGVEKDPAQAQLWYGRAAAQGVDKSDDVFVFRP